MRLLMILAAGLILALAAAVPTATIAQEAVSDCEGCPELVPLGDGGLIGSTLVTRDQFKVFADETGFAAEGDCIKLHDNQWGPDPALTWIEPGFEQAGDHPVVCVTWLDATAYVDWLSERTGKPYRLPTVEESNTAAFADSPGPYAWGGDKEAICLFANTADQSYKSVEPNDTQPLWPCDDGYPYTSPVTAFPPNSLGVYDGTGNVWQWTNTCLEGDCSNAVTRGGGWNVPWERFYQVGESFGDRILLKNNIVGFRVFRDPE
jgi:formylglycine-generating enzyme